jgi:hypothetical protein
LVDRYEKTLPYEEIEQIFNAVVAEHKPAEESGKRQSVTVIDSKRAQNIGKSIT